MIYFVLLCMLPMTAEVGVGEPPWIYLWPSICVVLAVEWCGRTLLAPSTITVHPSISTAYILLLITWIISLVGSFPTSMLPLNLGTVIEHRIAEAFLTSSILLASMSAAKNPRQIERIFKVIVYSSIPYAISIFFLGEEIESSGEIGRRSGVFVDVGPASTYMLFATILAFALVRNGVQPVFFSVCIALFLIVQLETNSKTAIVAMAMLIVIAPILDGDWRRAIKMALGGLVALLALIPLLPTSIQNALLQTFVSLFIDATVAVAGQGGTFAYRIEHFWIGMDLAQQYPLFGFGLGKHIVLSEVLHMTYATILAETGGIGFFAFFAVVVAVLRSAFQSLRVLLSQGNMQGYYLLKALFLSYILVLLTMTTQPWRGQEDRLFWLLAGLIAGIDIWTRHFTSNNIKTAKQYDNADQAE